jgi:BirA family biotin operon repressor/biotin-[acetyl-CoA-carboxylase] ligase
MSTIKIIKVNATRSTNDKVKMLIKSKKINSGCLISAKYQYGGRGQLSNRWNSSYGKNLICSLYYNFPKIPSNSPFTINYAVSLAVLKTVRKFTSNNVLIKWPNDILSGDKKISGILIENSIKSNEIYSTIIGTGININQMIFRNLPNATSIKYSAKKDISVDVVLKELSKEYHKNLYGLERCTFFIYGKTLIGKIIKVQENGKIQVKIDSLGIGEYNSGEIKIII